MVLMSHMKNQKQEREIGGNPVRGCRNPPFPPTQKIYTANSTITIQPSNLFIILSLIEPLFHNYMDQLIMKLYTEDDVNQALQAIANGQSLCKASLE